MSRKIISAAVIAATALLSAAPAAAWTGYPVVPQTDGTRLVPSEIAPGVYRATPASSVGGYVAVCADIGCDVGEGMIKNYLVTGPTYVVVPSNAVAIELKRVDIVRVQ